MSYFPKFKLTKAGEQLINRINGNLSEVLKITRVEIGSGTIANEDEIRFLTALKKKVIDAQISNHEVIEEERAKTVIEIQFTNKGFTSEVPFKEIGIFASGKDGKEILFLYTNAMDKYDNIPAENENPHAIIIDVVIQVTTDAEIEAFIDLSAFVTIKNFNKYKEEIEKRLLKIENKNSEAVSRLEVIENYLNLDPREATLGAGYLGDFYLG